ncbi:MAG: hypothetical protein LUE20_08450 [Oscillospiraceae bacterium]|nr:hypothetical protein [Oscillospiraceae bacterium]
MRLIILSNLKDRFPAYVRVTLMLTVMMFILSSLMGDILPLIQIRQAYSSLGLENAVAITADSDIKSVVEDLGGKYLGVSFRGKYTYDSFAYLQPVEADYFENLNYSFKKQTRFEVVDGYPAVIVSSLGSYYTLGETYTEVLSGKDKTEVTFTVVGILKSDFVYLTPSDDSPSSVVSEQSNYIFLITDEDDDIFTKKDVYGALATGDVTDFCSSIVGTGLVESAISTAAGFAEYCALELEIMGMTVMLAIISVLLCLAGVISNSILSRTVFAEKYRIISTCGANTAQCRTTQIITDLIPIIAAVIIFTVINALRNL